MPEFDQPRVRVVHAVSGTTFICKAGLCENCLKSLSEALKGLLGFPIEILADKCSGIIFRIPGSCSHERAVEITKLTEARYRFCMSGHIAG